jgi:predicted dehydrogenase
MKAVRVGMLGSGFVADFYMLGLRDVPGQEVVANYSRTADRARAFGDRWQIGDQHESMSELCGRDDVDLVVIALPNSMHLDAVRVASAAGKDMVCTKPLGRTASEAAEMVELVREGGLMNGYAETEVFAPAVVRTRELIESSALGRVLTVRVREAHSGPHSPHFWDRELTGGGALLDMGAHTVEVARYFFGKDLRPATVMAWGATLQHGARTDAEDNAVLMLCFEDGRLAISEASWTSMGGMELRNEVYGTEGRIITDTRDTNMTVFTTGSAGYMVEKADTETGWLFPIPDEASVYGYKQEMAHFVECQRTGTTPRETFVDGYIVNEILDAAYRSMKSRAWEAVTLAPRIVASDEATA